MANAHERMEALLAMNLPASGQAVGHPFGNQTARSISSEPRNVAHAN